jgi:Protein of unknown function (DUF5661)
MIRTIRSGFTLEQARAVAEELGIALADAPFDLDQFRRGMDIELEHGRRDPATNVTDDDPILTGKIAWAHLRELPDYYERLDALEWEPELRDVVQEAEPIRVP